jgi:hypothetical protein
VTTQTRSRCSALLAILVIVVAGLACGSAAAASCGDRVVADWSDGRIDGIYPLHCYQSALHDLPEDVRAYSSAADDITRALEQRVRTGSASTRVLDSAAPDDPKTGGMTSHAYRVAAVGIGIAATAVAVWGTQRARRRR